MARGCVGSANCAGRAGGSREWGGGRGRRGEGGRLGTLLVGVVVLEEKERGGCLCRKEGTSKLGRSSDTDSTRFFIPSRPHLHLLIHLRPPAKPFPRGVSPVPTVSTPSPSDNPKLSEAHPRRQHAQNKRVFRQRPCLATQLRPIT